MPQVGDTVKRRDGGEAKLIHRFKDGRWLAVHFDGVEECCYKHLPDGRMYHSSTDGPRDLIFEPEHIEGYINVYPWSRDCDLYCSRSDADDVVQQPNSRIARVKVKIPYFPGQFDE